MKKNYYFESFKNLINYVNQAIDLLNITINNYNYLDLSKIKTKMHFIKQTVELEKHKIMKSLAKEFITPFDIEDIIDILNNINDNTNYIERIILKLFIYNIKELKENVKGMMNIIMKYCIYLKNIFNDLDNYKKSSQINDYFIKLNTLKEEESKLYLESLRYLYIYTCNPKELIIWTDIFNCFQYVNESFNKLVCLIEKVILKNK